MLSVSSFGWFSLRLLLLPPRPLFLWAPLLLRGPAAFGVLLPLPLFSVLFDPVCPRVLLLEVRLCLSFFLSFCVQFSSGSGFRSCSFCGGLLYYLLPTSVLSLSILPFSFSCPALLLYIVFFWFRFRVVRLVILFRFFSLSFLTLVCLLLLCVFRSVFSRCSTPRGLRGWGRGGSPSGCWLFLFFCTWVVKRSDHSTVLRFAWTRPPAQRPSGSCNPWVTSWHCSTSAPLACALIDQAVVSVPLRMGSKVERPVHSAPISLDSASGLTPQWGFIPGSRRGTAPPQLLSPVLCLAWLRCLSLFAACQ